MMVSGGITKDGLSVTGDRVSVSGGCEAAVTARTKCRNFKLTECVELLYGRRFP